MPERPAAPAAGAAACMDIQTAEPAPFRPPDADLERACQSVKGFAHPIRMKILCVLAEQDLPVNDLAAVCHTSQSNISQHLGILRNCGILTAQKRANYVYYRISDPRMLSLMQLLREMFCPQPH